MATNNTVTNEQESFFRAITKTSVTIEAVDPVGTQTTTSAPAKTETTTPVEVESKAHAPVKAERNWFPTVGAILAGLLGFVLIVALGWFLYGRLSQPAPSNVSSDTGSAYVPASGGSTNAVGGGNSAPISSENSEAWKAVLTSANSNGNFIADLGGHGNGSVIPATAIDLQGNSWTVGRVLLTYCEDASNCFYAYGKPGDKLSRAFNVNSYTPQCDGDLYEELQYIDTGWNNNADVQWTYINN